MPALIKRKDLSKVQQVFERSSIKHFRVQSTLQVDLNALRKSKQLQKFRHSQTQHRLPSHPALAR